MKCFIVMSIAVLASGCSGGFHRDVQPTQVYMLRASAVAQTPASSASAATPAALTLRIGRTAAAPGLDSDRIVLMRADHRMDFYAASRWAAPLPEVIEALAVETLRGTGAWTAVNDSQGAFPGEYFLQINIRRFEADYTQSGDPKIEVSFACSLGRRADRELLASFIAEGTATASANRVGAVVEAFEKAANDALATVAARTLETVQSASGRDR